LDFDGIAADWSNVKLLHLLGRTGTWLALLPALGGALGVWVGASVDNGMPLNGPCRLLRFGRFAAQNHEKRGLGKPETFKFLGLVLICGKSRQGDFQIRRKSRGDRMSAKLREIKEALRQRRHVPVPEVGKWLAQVVAGYFAYHAVPTNSPALSASRYHVVVPVAPAATKNQRIQRPLATKSSSCGQSDSTRRSLRHTAKRQPWRVRVDDFGFWLDKACSIADLA
jgi:hypothetical protein